MLFRERFVAHNDHGLQYVGAHIAVCRTDTDQTKREGDRAHKINVLFGDCGIVNVGQEDVGDHWQISSRVCYTQSL